MDIFDYANRYLMPAVEWLIYAVTLHRTLGQGKRKMAAGVLIYALVAGLTIVSYYLALRGIISSVAFMAVILTIVARIIYQAPPHVAAVFCISVFYINILSDLLLGNLTMVLFPGDIESALAGNSSLRLIFSVAAKILQCILSASLILGFKRISWHIPTIYWNMLTTAIILYFFIAVAFSHVNPYVQTIVPPWIVTLSIVAYIIVNVLTLGLFSTISAHYIKSQIEYISQITKSRLDNDIMIFEREKSALRRTNHDFKNTLSNIAFMIQDSAYSTALDYISQYTDSLPLANTAEYTGVGSIDSIISLKVAAAAVHSVSVTVNAENIAFDAVSTIDIASIISNILDNAIDASRDVQQGKRQITLQIYTCNETLNIIATNPYRSVPLRVNNRLISSKADIDSHGYGTIIVREICEQYSGNFVIEYQSGIFTAHATLLEASSLP